MPRVWHRSQALVTRRAKRKQEIAADARQAPKRDKIGNVTGYRALAWTALRWTALRVLEGGLPEAGKVLFRIGAGGLVGLAARWLFGD